MPCHVTSSVTMSAARVVSKLYFWYPVTQNWPKCWYTNSSNSLWQKLNTPNLITDLHTYHNIILILNCMSHLFCGTAPSLCVCVRVCLCVCKSGIFPFVWTLLMTRYEFNIKCKFNKMHGPRSFSGLFVKFASSWPGLLTDIFWIDLISKPVYFDVFIL